MSIHLSVEADDPEVERLLDHLQTQYKLSNGDKIYLLERAIKWLKPTTELYGVSLGRQDSQAPTRAVVSIVHSDKRGQRQLATELAVRGDHK
ncbi:MAG TPA: hypothetical protein VME86_15385 [Acidobacteriaceae bacterium]|nr:hypothetical protein [Acidobacteriaceae bacterium]